MFYVPLDLRLERWIYVLAQEIGTWPMNLIKYVINQISRVLDMAREFPDVKFTGMDMGTHEIPKMSKYIFIFC